MTDLNAEDDSDTVPAIENGITQLDAGQGIPLEELRMELAKRCGE